MNEDKTKNFKSINNNNNCKQIVKNNVDKVNEEMATKSSRNDITKEKSFKETKSNKPIKEKRPKDINDVIDAIKIKQTVKHLEKQIHSKIVKETKNPTDLSEHLNEKKSKEGTFKEARNEETKTNENEETTPKENEETKTKGNEETKTKENGEPKTRQNEEIKIKQKEQTKTKQNEEIKTKQKEETKTKQKEETKTKQNEETNTKQTKCIDRKVKSESNKPDEIKMKTSEENYAKEKNKMPIDNLNHQMHNKNMFFKTTSFKQKNEETLTLEKHKNVEDQKRKTVIVSSKMLESSKIEENIDLTDENLQKIIDDEIQKISNENVSECFLQTTIKTSDYINNTIDGNSLKNFKQSKKFDQEDGRKKLSLEEYNNRKRNNTGFNDVKDDEVPHKKRIKETDVRRENETVFTTNSNCWEDDDEDMPIVLQTSLTKNTQIENIPLPSTNKNIIDMNEFNIKPLDCSESSTERSFSNNSAENDTLQLYKDVVDSKLNSLKIEIPTLSKTKQLKKLRQTENARKLLLIKRFLSESVLKCGELEKVKKMIECKRKCEGLRSSPIAEQSDKEGTDENANDNNSDKERRRRRKRRKKRFRNLYSSKDTSDEDESSSDNYSTISRRQMAGRGVHDDDDDDNDDVDDDDDDDGESYADDDENGECSGNYSVYQRGEMAGVIPKLIFKRKSGLPQPFVKLERSQAAELLLKNKNAYCD